MQTVLNKSMLYKINILKIVCMQVMTDTFIYRTEKTTVSCVDNQSQIKKLQKNKKCKIC